MSFSAAFKDKNVWFGKSNNKSDVLIKIQLFFGIFIAFVELNYSVCLKIIKYLLRQTNFELMSMLYNSFILMGFYRSGTQFYVCDSIWDNTAWDFLKKTFFKKMQQQTMTWLFCLNLKNKLVVNFMFCPDNRLFSITALVPQYCGHLI